MEVYKNNNKNNMIIDDTNQTYYIASEVDYSTLIASISNASDKLDVLIYLTIVAIIVTSIMAFVDLYIQYSIKNSKNVLVEACIIDIEQPFINNDKTKHDNNI
jgi:hypothetical protein